MKHPWHDNPAILLAGWLAMCLGALWLTIKLFLA